MKKTVLAAALACLLPVLSQAQIVLKPRASLSSSQLRRLAASVKAAPVRYLPYSRLYVLAPEKGQTDQGILQKLSGNPSVLYAARVREVSQPQLHINQVMPARRGQMDLRTNSITAQPNDPFFNRQWHLAKIGANKAWLLSAGAPVTVAIIDSGANPIDDLKAHLAPGWNVVDNNSNTAEMDYHGTLMADLIGGVCNNGIGIAGTACVVRIMPVRVFIKPHFMTTMPYLAEGIHYAADHGARVINFSPTLGSTSTGLLTEDPTVRDAIAYARSKGVIMVTPVGPNVASPANLPPNPDVIYVSGTDENDRRASCADFGATVTLAAPATNIVTENSDGTFGIGSCGQSFASAIVSATVAMMLSANPRLSYNQVRTILTRTAVHLPQPGMGAGRINTLAAVQAAVALKASLRPPTTPKPPAKAVKKPVAKNPIAPPKSSAPATKAGQRPQPGSTRPAWFPKLNIFPLRFPSISSLPLFQDELQR